jgi:DNA-binding transcriptional LysR family regulator
MLMFVAVVEEGSATAAARRLHISQPALSQAMVALERRLGLDRLVRHRTGVSTTDAGLTLLLESQAVLSCRDRALAALTRHDAPGDVSRLGIPLELPPDLWLGPLARLGAAHPETQVQARHASTAAHNSRPFAAESSTLGWSRNGSAGPDLDAPLVAEERLGVLLARTTAKTLATDRGVRLDALAGREWVGFPRSGSPAWSTN